MKWAVLVGGTGSNLEAILSSGLDVRLVISHRAQVRALGVAAQHGVPTRVIVGRDYPDRADYDASLRGQLEEFDIERVAMAGFLRWLQPETIRVYQGQILNLHPSLLPAYPGLHAIEQAFEARVWWTGVTVHFVDEGHDTGPIVAQAPVPRMADDTLETLSDRIHRTEHALYPKVLHAVDRGAVWLQDHVVTYAKEDDAWIHGHF